MNRFQIISQSDALLLERWKCSIWFGTWPVGALSKLPVWVVRWTAWFSFVSTHPSLGTSPISSYCSFCWLNFFLQFWFCFRTNLADNLNFELCVWNFAFIFDKLTLSVEFWVEFWPPICCFSSLFICFCFVSTLIEIIRNVLSYLLLYISFPRCFRASHFPDVDLSPSMTYLRWSIYLVVPFKSQ